MIIDCILDRKDNEKYGNSCGGIFAYRPRFFYFAVLRYGRIGDEITRAMDEGTEADVKRALCKYIDDNGYNPEIKNYINSRRWL